MFKMSAFSVDTGRQTTPPLVDGVVHNVHYRVLVQWTPLFAIASESRPHHACFTSQTFYQYLVFFC